MEHYNIAITVIAALFGAIAFVLRYVKNEEINELIVYNKYTSSQLDAYSDETDRLETLVDAKNNELAHTYEDIVQYEQALEYASNVSEQLFENLQKCILEKAELRKRLTDTNEYHNHKYCRLYDALNKQKEENEKFRHELQHYYDQTAELNTYVEHLEESDEQLLKTMVDLDNAPLTKRLKYAITGDCTPFVGGEA